MSDPIITARDVFKDFEGADVLDGIDLEVGENETTLLMGPNGAGKTILLACLAGGLHPSRGTIEIMGESVGDARADMSFLIQGGLGLPDLTGRENVEFYRDLHPAATDGWQDIAEQMEMTEHLDRPVRDYSGGMLRKLELAITLSVDVPLYLLDEPTAELDLTTIDRLHSLIEQKREEGRTVVMTSHTPLDVEVADRIVFVQHGRAVADGAPEELMDAVPDVVRFVGPTDTAAASEYLQDGQLFESGDGRRGFIREGVDVEALPEKVARDGKEPRVEVEEPSYTDLFNYYTRIVPEQS